IFAHLVEEIRPIAADGRAQHRRGAARVEHVAAGVIERQTEAGAQPFLAFGHPLLDLVGSEQIEAPELIVRSPISPRGTFRTVFPSLRCAHGGVCELLELFSRHGVGAVPPCQGRIFCCAIRNRRRYAARHDQSFPQGVGQRKTKKMDRDLLSRRAHSLADMRRLAQRRLPRVVFDFVDGGAEDELALRRNEAALAQTLLLPRPLEGTSARDQSVELFGQRLNGPVLIGPTGFAGLLWPRAEAASARAAAAAGTVYTMSHASTV